MEATFLPGQKFQLSFWCQPCHPRDEAAAEYLSESITLATTLMDNSL